MSENTEAIISYLEALHANRHLVAAAYINGGVTMEEDNQRRIRQLQQHRALVPYVHDEFRLNSSLGRHLDEVFQRQRNYVIGANFGEQINRLQRLADEFLKASHEDRLDDRDNYATDFDVGVFELREGIASTLLMLRTLTDNRFANVSTIAEKQRQNEFYIAKVEQLGSALAMLQTDLLLEQLAASTLLDPLMSIYRHQVLDRLPEWRATILDITTVLKAYLYRLRQVEPDARRVRSFALFLKKNPGYEPPDSDSLTNAPVWVSKFAGLQLRSHPDLGSGPIRDGLAEIAQGVPPATVSIVRERQSGRLLDDTDAKRVVTLPVKPVQVAYRRYIDAVHAQAEPLSALEWKRQQLPYADLDDRAWLLYVMHSLRVGAARASGTRGIGFSWNERPPAHVRSGNIVVDDVLAWKRT